MSARRLLRAAALAVVCLCAPLTASAEPSPQFVASVQHRLDMAGFAQVDATSLTTRQLAALHMQIGSRYAVTGPRWIEGRERVKAILRWDGFETRR